MRFILIILFYNSCIGQDYVTNFKTIGLEKNVVNYQIQYSKDSLGVYTTLVTLQPKKSKDSNNYTYTLPVASNYYRIKSLMTSGTFYSKPIKIINTNVSITNAKVVFQSTGDKLSWNAANESAVNYYNINRSVNGGSFSLVGKVTQRGLKDYVLNVSKVAGNKRYNIIAYYKNGNISSTVNFN